MCLCVEGLDNTVCTFFTLTLIGQEGTHSVLEVSGVCYNTEDATRGEVLSHHIPAPCIQLHIYDCNSGFGLGLCVELQLIKVRKGS